MKPFRAETQTPMRRAGVKEYLLRARHTETIHRNVVVFPRRTSRIPRVLN